LDQASAAQTSGEVTDLERLLEAAREHAATEGAGVLLIIDEMGKFLEHAAQRPDREDVFVLQRLAERASRSGNHPFLILGLLHQGFQAYAERLPSAAKHEWEKVAGRFDEIVFDQPLAHTARSAPSAGGMKSITAAQPVSVWNSVSRTRAPGRYRRLVASAGCCGAMSHRPLSTVPIRLAKHAAESNRGQHNQSIDPSRRIPPLRAAFSI